MRRYRAIIAGLALAAGLAGCAGQNPGETLPAGENPPEEGASGSPEASAGSGGAAPETGASGAGAAAARNALELTGPAEAADVPDMQTVVTGVEPSLPATLTDASGSEVTITSAERILSLDLYGTLTDTLIGLGLDDRLVGRANSDTQDALEDLPVVTRGGHDLNVEAVLQLEPDLVLTNTTIGSEAMYEQLESAGVTVVRFEQVPSLDNIETEILQVGQALGVEAAAEELAEHTSSELEGAKEQVDALRSQTPREPRGAVLYIRGTAGVFFIVGADYGASEILDFLGLEDVAKANGITDLKPANAESLVSLDPEIILAMSEGVASTGGIDGLLERPGMSATTAGEKERIITAPDTQLLSYGPRTPENLLALAEAIYTDTGGD